MAVRFSSRNVGLHVEVSEMEAATRSLVRWQGGPNKDSKQEAFELYPDRGFDEALGLYRHKPPWTAPAPVSQLSQLPGETLFALARTGTSIVVLCPLANLAKGVVASLRGSQRGLDDFEVVIRSEGDATEAAVLLILECVDMGAAAAARLAAQEVAQTLRSEGWPFQLRAEKPLPELFARWGWCSWDAHGVAVKAEHLEAMAAKHCPPWLVLDDGWQEDVNPAEWRQWLHTPQTRRLARPGFGSLQDLVGTLRRSGSSLLVWHTLLGYWGGVADGQGFAVARRRPVWPSGLQEGCPGEVDVWDGDFCALEMEDEERFYEDFYTALADAGVAGVKCDGQFLPEVLVGAQRAAKLAQTQAAAAARMGGRVISCMAMTLPCVHGGSAVLTRVSDDHAYPGVPEDARSVARHIWHCAANSLWLSPFVHCDWDMLKTGEWHSGIHAAARAVAGCLVYVSDPAESFDPEVLRPLLLPDGTGLVVPCQSSAVPIERHVFLDPLSRAELVWLRNETKGGHIAAAFGLCDTQGEIMSSTLYPADVDEEPGSHACLQVDPRGLGHAGEFTAKGWDVQLHFMGFMVLALAPILSLFGQRLAVFGLAGIWNPTGTLAEPPSAGSDGLNVRLLSAGRLLLWSEGALSLLSAAGPVMLQPGLNSLDVSDTHIVLTTGV
ncbi:RFS [Symbiodinium natans]|uniref:galactinol--sucrose galactosyltransferase n=1 Tax=Symbiodinium natans TaxID=878477 RepID=A0A812U3D5_9DINO|nr:RFS [Symbiodinium natans]